MELMDMKDYDIDFKEKRTNGYLIATLFIIVGILFLLRNLGMIDPSLFDLLVSWPMLLVVSGIFMIFHRNPVGGMLLVGVGVYFLFPQLNWITNDFLRSKSCGRRTPRLSRNPWSTDGTPWCPRPRGTAPDR